MILQYLGEGEDAGKSPKDVYEVVSLMEGNSISADLVRTQLWRMAKRGVLESKDGRYWKPQKKEALGSEPKASNSVGPADGSQGRASHPSPEGSIPSGSTRVQPVPFDTDLDDDVPF